MNFSLHFRLPDYATRACLMSTEAFKARGMFADAAFEFIKLTNEVGVILMDILHNLSSTGIWNLEDLGPSDLFFIFRRHIWLFEQDWKHDSNNPFCE